MNREPNEVVIEKLVYGGDGLGRLNGRVLLTPYVLPGERVAVAEARGSAVHVKLSRVIEPSPDRIQADCPYFARCGGCHYQHTHYDNQREQKVSILREVLRRVGKLDAPERIEVIAGAPWQYRNRSQFHYQQGQFGYLEAGSHKLCAIEFCPISSPQVNAALTALREMAKERRFPNFLKTVEVFTNETDTQLNVLESTQPVARHFFDWCAERIPGMVPGPLTYATVAGKFRVSGKSFFQVNRFLVDALVEEALFQAEGSTAVDLYAGVGLFSIPLARRFQAVSAVESSASAVADLTHNMETAGVTIRAERMSADPFLSTLTEAPDFVLADPPRTGLGKQAVKNLVRLQPKRLTIVACDPATLARDLNPLLAAGYRISRLTMADLFPQTFHIETVVHLQL
ncbi:MAG TPA: class I SAM-dependent RNA methyltransferase [Bryobacteraceae bacterium]|nr:class I SAM-dependent RNA methyltransferase [Bryobacteraceae bacterium]